MATARILSDGLRIDYTPGSAVAAGDVIVVGDTVGVAPVDIAANVLGSLTLQGTVRLPKATTSVSALSAGVKVYWNAGSSVVTTTSSGNKCVGYTEKAATAAASTVNVILSRA